MRLTKDLIKKKAEHNDGITADLEEISLHQLEIEKIEVIGHLCKKLKILYLQNNIISKIENLEPLKDLEYLNLALNNIEKIEGLKYILHSNIIRRTCEFLNKLDLTVNFVDLDALEESIENLKCNTHLKELYLIGNPCCEWEGCKNYIIASLPQLQKLDGNDITRSDRIKAAAELEKNTKELKELAVKKAIEKKNKKPKEYDPDHCENTPETRLHMYRELAEQKQEEENKRNANLPKQRNYELEHLQALERERGLERQGVIRQCNQGHWNFRFGEEIDKNRNINNLILEIDFPRFLSTSLIDADIQPLYISVVAKGKTLRLELPEEVQSDKSKIERSTTTGTLKLIMPKVDKGSTLHTFETIDELNIEKKNKNKNNNLKENDSGRVKLFNKSVSKGEQILEAVSLKGIVKNENNEDEMLLKERKTIKTTTTGESVDNNLIECGDDDIPPLI